MKKRIKLGDVVKAEWIDSSGMSAYWFNKADVVCELLHCTTVGKLIMKTDDSILIAQSWNDYQFGGCIEIPKVNVKRLTLINKCK
jgi:hypothetical protein